MLSRFECLLACCSPSQLRPPPPSYLAAADMELELRDGGSAEKSTAKVYEPRVERQRRESERWLPADERRDLNQRLPSS